MADFTYEGTTKKVKVAAVKPSLIGTLFKLKEDTIVICDLDKGEVHLPDGNSFDPPLLDGHQYSVDGTELAAIERQREIEIARQTAADQLAAVNQVALNTRNRDVAGIKGKPGDHLIRDVISETKSLNQSVGMLYNGPQAVVLVEALAILAGAAPDPSLVSEEMPAKRFKRLKTPSSFKASLYQVASSMCNAFRTADTSMMSIKANLADLPDDFVSTLEVFGEENDVATQKILKRTTDRIAQASEKCVEMAKKSSQAFNEVILDIDELCQAAINAKGTNEKALRELEKLKVELAQSKQTLEQQEQELRKQHEETKTRAKEALAEYKDQVKNSGDVGKMFLAFLADGVMDTVKAVVSLPSRTLEKFCEKLPALPGSESCSSTMRYALESSLLQMLEKIVDDLAQPGDMGEEIVNDYIMSFKSLEKYSPMTDEGKELYKRAKKVREFLEKERMNLKDPAMKKKIDELRVSVGNVVVAAKSVREERKQAKDRETAAKFSFAEKLVQAETDQTRMAQSHYTEESQKQEQYRKELKETTLELSGILSKMQNLNLEEVDLEDIISYLREGIGYLGKVKENWNELTRFFDAILLLVETNLKGNIDTFLTEAKDPAARGRMLKSALKATGYCIQVGNCAEIYTQISSKYVMPSINGIGKQFALTRQEARAKKDEITEMLNVSVEGVQSLIEKEREKFNERFEEQMCVYADSYANCITDRPVLNAIGN